MERRALTVPYSCVVKEHALGRAAEAQDVAQYLNTCRGRQETRTGGRRSYIMGRERDALEDAIGAAEERVAAEAVAVCYQE